MATTLGICVAATSSATLGSCTSSLSGCTPALAQKLSYSVASACTDANSSIVVLMHSARVTRQAMAARTPGMSPASSGKVRWQWESVNMQSATARQRNKRPPMLAARARPRCRCAHSESGICLPIG